MLYGLNAPELDCSNCPEKKRKQRNCHNKQRRKESIVDKVDWQEWPASLKPVQKWSSLKFYECPRSAVTNRTWDILGLVNETTNCDGEVLHLPFPGAWLEQPQWYRQAVQVVKSERAIHRAKVLANPPKKGK